MTRVQISCLILFCILIEGCGSPRILTVWKSEHSAPIHYNKIMVVGIIKEENDSLKAEVEKQMADQLNALGYYAVSALQEFGRYGLTKLGEEGTYLKLCDNGIDAVLTLSLIDKSNKAYQKKVMNEKYTNIYYYNRIWSYRKIQNDTVQQGETFNPHYIWESILFDLSSLAPQFVLQTANFATDNSKKEIAELPRWLIKKMLHEKIIKKRKPGSVSPKPF
jgi:hypothetical protein